MEATTPRKLLILCYTTLLVLLCLSGPLTSLAQDNFSKVDQWLNDNVRSLGGRTFLIVYKDDKVVYTQAATDMNGKQKMAGKFIAKRQGKEWNGDDYTASTKLPIASCSKWLSAAVVMTFVDEGKLQVTDTVGKYLPVLTQHGKGNITIGDCLTHLTGIKEADGKEGIREIKDASSMDEVIENIAKQPMEGQPGTVFHYSNAGLQIAAAVVEKISGKNFQTLLAEKITDPLNMKNTDFNNRKVAFPAGGIYSTPEDYIHFLTMLLNKGAFNGKRILSESSIAAMQVNRITSNIKTAYVPLEAGNKGYGYGYGEWVMDNAATDGGTKWVCSPGLFGSFPWLDNEKHYAAFLLTFNLKRDGRMERYKQLKQLVDDAVR